MRISDWSSDVCSSDLHEGAGHTADIGHGEISEQAGRQDEMAEGVAEDAPFAGQRAVHQQQPDRKSVVSGKRVSVRVDLGGRRIIKKKKSKRKSTYTIACAKTKAQLYIRITVEK